MKKRGKKKSRKSKKIVRPVANGVSDEPVSFGVLPEDRTDYGGLPQLDLKKNLGCG